MALAVLAPVLLLLGLAPAPVSAAQAQAGSAGVGARSWPEPVPVVSHVATDDPVVFITIDDGWHHDPAAQRLLLERQVPASLFLLPDAYAYDRSYFRTLLDHGPSRVENHSVSHPNLTGLDAAGQRAEICEARDRHLAAFGDGPRLLRPPFGAYDETTRTAARACGATALVTWTHDFTTWGEQPPPAPQLKRGDIVLLHFTPGLSQDLARALDAAEAAGLKPAKLRQYLAD